jgi:hypothetical protein
VSTKTQASSWVAQNACASSAVTVLEMKKKIDN